MIAFQDTRFKKKLVFCVIAFLVFFLWLSFHRGPPCCFHHHEFNDERFPDTTSRQQQHGKNLVDGCKNVFLDFGGNIGVHSRFLYQPHLYPRTMFRILTFDPGYASYFDAIFGPPGVPDRREACVLGVEANPHHQARLKQIEACFNESRNVQYFVPAALGVEDGETNFFVKDDDNEIAWGGKTGDKDTFKDSKGSMVRVPVLGAARILKEVFSRKYDDSRGKGKILAKMDVEGSELLILPLLESKGYLCADEGRYGFVAMTLEGHEDAFDAYARQKKIDPRFPTFNSFIDYYSDYHRTQRGKYNCTRPTRIDFYDSEDYHMDNEFPLDHFCHCEC